MMHSRKVSMGAINEIQTKIIGVAVRKDSTAETEKEVISNVIHLHEKVERPTELYGTTYKIYPGADTEHAMYVTINNIILNKGTPNEVVRPFEIFVNTKNVSNYAWIVALTRLMSAVFRKGGDITFMIEELESVFSPQGGYWKKGKYYNSIIHEIGEVIRQHLETIGILKTKIVTVKREVTEIEMKNATICPKCNNRAVVKMEGCSTCMNCGDSKCQ